MSRGGGFSLFLLLSIASVMAACSRKPTEPVAKDTLAPLAVTDLSILTTTDTSITLVWTATADDDGKKRVAGYEIRQALDPLTVYYWTGATPLEPLLTAHDPGAPETLEVDHLMSHKKYYFGIKSVDASGNHSPVSNILPANPGDRTPPASIQDLRVTATGSNSGT